MYPNRYVLRHYCMTYGHEWVQCMYDVLRGSGNGYSGVELYDYYGLKLYDYITTFRPPIK